MTKALSLYMLPIHGNGFVLRPLKATDAVSLAKHANDFDIWLNLKDGLPHPYRHSDAAWFINHVSEDKPAQKLGIVIADEVCGVIGINLLADVYAKTADLGYWLGKTHWGKGYMSAVVAAFVPYIFEQFDLHKISAGVYSRNNGSVRILEKNGFTLEGVLKQHAFKNGRFEDECRYGLIRP